VADVSRSGLAPGQASTRWELDLNRHRHWMDDRDLGAGPIHDARSLDGGTQNVMLRFRRGVDSYVFRAPPCEKRPESDVTMRREVRVLAALEGSPVPHPGVIASEDSVEPLGAAFYLMQPVDGFTPTAGLPPAIAADRDWQHRMGLSVVDAIAALAAVPLGRLDPAMFRDPAGWLERQPSRWRRHLASYAGLPGYTSAGLTGIDDLGRWLETRLPRSWQPGLIHGDYHFGNVLIDAATARVNAIVDWELATIGDPLLDLGHMLAVWPSMGIAMPPHLAAAALPDRDEIVHRYAERSGRDVTEVEWYQVLACFRLGIILEGTKARADAGLADRETGDRLHLHSQQLIAQARELAAT
jgi:aminoglycoside phosphotransferase (APT) family kinase protein